MLAPSLPLLAVLVAAALIPGVVDAGMPSSTIVARILGGVRVFTGSGLLLWAILSPWRA